MAKYDVKFLYGKESDRQMKIAWADSETAHRSRGSVQGQGVFKIVEAREGGH